VTAFGWTRPKAELTATVEHRILEQTAGVPSSSSDWRGNSPITADLGVLFGRAKRRSQWRAVTLIAPPIVFVLLTFVMPIGVFMFRAVDNRDIAHLMPRTIESLADWDGKETPAEASFEALSTDLRQAQANHAIGLLASNLGQKYQGLRPMLMQLANLSVPAGGVKTAAVAANPRWNEPAVWSVIARQRAMLTPQFLLLSVDLTQDWTGRIVAVDPNQALFAEVIVRSVWIALVVTVLTLLVGFPVAYLIAGVGRHSANLLLILVLLPFWTSLLVRTLAWMILLDDRGVINNVLTWAHLIDAPLHLMYNRLGVYIGMVYVFLPFIVLPLYATMLGVPKESIRAAASLGANRIQAFRYVFLPQVVPGTVAGTVTVGVLSVGYYITPLLLGGPHEQMLSYFVSFFINGTLNWNMAAALAFLLLVLVVACLSVVLWAVGLKRLNWS
jgi:putative spermidine/putrescine transport system permease protein